MRMTWATATWDVTEIWVSRPPIWTRWLPKGLVVRLAIRAPCQMKAANKNKKSEHLLVHSIIDPFIHEIHLKDVLQIIIGSTILAVPVGFTEETWRLGEKLPWINVIGILLLSVLFISIFIYYNYYRGKIRHHWDKFIERIIITYLVAFIIVSVILTLIDMAPWSTDIFLSLKRIIIVALPSSMSAAIADMIK